MLNRSEQKLDGLANGIVHTSWPIVAILVGLSIASVYYARLAAYQGILSVLRGSFLPVYGSALVVGLLVLLLPRLIRWLRNRPSTPAPAGVGAGMQPTAPLPRPTRSAPDGGSGLPPSGGTNA